jgi:hypothetical protein
MVPPGTDDDAAASQQELSKLREEPDGPKPRVKPRTALQELPLGELAWPDFEKLIERLVELEGDPADYVSRYGGPGDDQEGIDIYSRLQAAGGYIVYQCKRYQKLQPYVIANAVDEFLDNKWSRPGERFAKRFVFCTSFALSGRTLADEIEKQAGRLRAHDPPVEFDAWGQEKLSKKLKAHPELVEDFFGEAFVQLFSPGGTGRQAEGLGELKAEFAEFRDLLQAQASRQRVIVTTLAWAPELLKQILQRLYERDEAAFVALRDLVGEPPDIQIVLANIAAPAAWLRGAPAEAWQVLALMAEEKGEWLASSTAWQRSAELWDDDYAAAGDFVSAAASSHIGRNDTRRDAMLDAARERYSRHPRLVLEDVRDLAPQEQLDALVDVELRENVDIALIEGQRALACLLLPDLEEAERHVVTARDALPGSAVGESVAVNLLVQRARLNQVEGYDQQAATLREANRRALALRDGLLRQRRWGEAGRLLMLAADALGLQMEFSSAREILTQATAEELADPDVAEVLGHAAIRALGALEALTLTEGSPRTDAIRVIRAIALLERGGSSLPERAAAVNELDELVAGGGRYATDAAFARLIDAMGHGGWSDAADACLKQGGHERPALVLRAFYLGERKGDWEQAYSLFDDYEDRRWTLPARLRIAMRWGRHSVLRKAADNLMAEGPGQGLKLECARAYGKVGDYTRAREVLADVAGDTSAPAAVRAHAYFLLVATVGPRMDDWKAADRYHKKWVQIRPGDTRASMLAPTIANRLRRERS